MLQTFDLQGGLPLALARAASVAALLSTFGTLVFGQVCAPRAFAHMPVILATRVRARLRWLVDASVAVGILAMLAWLLLQAADMADADSLGQCLAALPAVLSGTRFGHLVALQLATLVTVTLLLGRRERPARRPVALGVAGVAVALQAGHGHAAAMYDGPSVLLAVAVAHLLGAGAWLGGLPPLLLLVRQSPPKAGAVAARWFSPLGQICLVAMLLSSAYQGWVMVASVPGLVGTAYGWVVLVKLALFGVLFGFAWLNRYRFAPALLGGDPTAAKRVLVRSVAAQTGFGLLIVVVAGILSGLQPAMHTQPLWPFAERFSLEAVREAPDFAREVGAAALALAGATVLVVVAALLRRRASWLVVAAAAAVAWFAAPHLDLLFVPAYPTSYYRSPTGFAATAIAAGAALYPAHCAACHGAEGRGDGAAGRGLADPPADLTAGHLWMHSDGELFWWLAHGIEGPEGGLVMPGFAATLSDDERWDLIDYVRAHNAGVTYRASGGWSSPIQAPGWQADCVDGRGVSQADFRGRFVRLVFGKLPAFVDPSVATILVTTDAAVRPTQAACVASDPAAPLAYAIATGMAPAEMVGTQVLVDGAGWLRAVQRPGAAPGWSDPKVLAAAIRDIEAHPINDGAEAGHAPMQM